MALLDDVKLRIRSKNNYFDTDIFDLIEACKIDLNISGVQVIDETNPITKQAIKLYCQAYYGDNENSEKFRLSYEALRTSMALCGDFKEVITNV